MHAADWWTGIYTYVHLVSLVYSVCIMIQSISDSVLEALNLKPVHLLVQLPPVMCVVTIHLSDFMK